MLKNTSAGRLDATFQEEARNVKEQRCEEINRGSRLCSHPNADYSSQRASLSIFEDNDAVIKMSTKGRSSTVRHVSRTHRVDLDWLFDIQIKYDNASKQIAEILTKVSFSRERWSQLTQLFDTTHARLLPFFGFIFVRAERRQDVET